MKLKKIINEEEKKLKREWKNIIFNFLVIILSLLIIILLYNSILVTTILLLIVSIIALAKWKSKLALFIYLFFGFIFGIGEMIITNYRVWVYNINASGNIPFWLFILWGITATFIYQTILEIKKLEVGK